MNVFIASDYTHLSDIFKDTGGGHIGCCLLLEINIFIASDYTRLSDIFKDTEAESIKGVDDMIVPPTRCTQSGLMIRLNTTFSDYISWVDTII